MIIAPGKAAASIALGNAHPPISLPFFGLVLWAGCKTKPKKGEYIYFIRVTPDGASLVRGCCLPSFQNGNFFPFSRRKLVENISK